MPLKHKVLVVSLAGLGWLVGCAGPLSLLGIPFLIGFSVWLGVRRYFGVLALVVLTSPMAVSASLATLDYVRGTACILKGGKPQIDVIDDETGLPVVSTGSGFWGLRLLWNGSHNATLRALSSVFGSKRRAQASSPATDRVSFETTLERPGVSLAGMASRNSLG